MNENKKINYTPDYIESEDVKKIGIFPFYMLQNFPFIEETFDAVTYYQMLCKIVEYLNDVIKAFNITDENFEKLDTNVRNLYEAFIKLQEYVNNYFDNLDVQSEINNKLDQMVIDGVFDNILHHYTDITKVYDTELDLIADKENIVGQKCTTLGYYKLNDGGASDYIITDVKSETEYQEDLQNGLYATLILKDNTLNVKQLGCHGDGVTDDTANLQKAINYCLKNYVDMVIDGNFLVNPQANNICLYFRGKDFDHLNINNIKIDFVGKSKIFTNSDKECTLIRYNAGKIIINNMSLSGVKDKTILLDMARIEDLSITEGMNTSYNLLNHFNFANAKTALNLEGATYYNNFNNGHIHHCTNGIIAGFTKAEKAGLKQDSACNRNIFNNITLTGVTNCIDLNYCDTMKFNNIAMEGCTNGIKLDDPSKHKGDFPITPLYFTNDNMFVNITFEKVKTTFNNNATGTKVINTSTPYLPENWKIAPQTYIGGTDDNYSMNKTGDFYSNKQNSRYLNSNPYSGICTSLNGFSSLTTYDFEYNESKDQVTMMNQMNLRFVLKEDSNIKDTISYDATLAKSIGGIVFISGKFKFKPTSTNTAIKLYFPTDKIWIQNANGTFSNVAPLRIPLVVNINGVAKITIATIATDNISIAPPEGNWATTNNDINLNFNMYRKKGLY